LRSELDGYPQAHPGWGAGTGPQQSLRTNLEAEEPDSEIANDIRARLQELAAVRPKKQQALEAADREIAQVSDPESAQALVDALPLLGVDWELVSDDDFRGLLAALNFEASYEPRSAS
jgi:hypothetical protein